MTKILLLDKDGALVVPASRAKFVNIPTDQKPMDGVNNAIDYYLKNDWNLMIISNQGGVAAGHKSLEDAIAEMRFAMDLFPGNQATPPQADGVWKQICSRILDSDCKPVVFAAERRGIYPY